MIPDLVKMTSQTVITDLVKTFRVKEEETENGETRVPELEHNINGCVKLERCEPEDKSTDSTSNDGNGIKTEVKYDYILSDERISSEGEESHIDEATYIYPTSVNRTLQSNMAGATCFFDKSGRTTQLGNMQEIQNSSSQNDGDFCECDVCGSFFCIDAQNISNKSQSSANLCPKCRRSTASNPSFLQEVFSTSTFSPTCKHPCSEKWPGRYNFNVQVISGNTRNGCLYSSQLNKLYSSMNSSVPIQFKCQWGNPDLYVRAVPVFLYEVTVPVVRCTHHMRPSEETNADSFTMVERRLAPRTAICRTQFQPARTMNDMGLKKQWNEDGRGNGGTSRKLSNHCYAHHTPHESFGIRISSQ